jgi:hypothetical protein
VSDDSSNGNRGRRIHLIEIEVDDEDVRWRDYPEWPRDHKFRDKGKLGRTDQRRASIDLLVELLEHHSDQTRADLISDDLYGRLLQVVGYHLFELLFVDDLRNRVAAALGRFGRSEIDLLRLKLSFEGRHQTWLARLPWEYVHTPPGDRLFDPAGVFLSHRAELMLSRLLDSPEPRQLGDSRPLTVLLVCPNPGDVPPTERIERVDPRKVIELFEELERKRAIRLVKLVDEAPDYPVEHPSWVTRRTLKRAIKEERPVIVHFFGHGRRNQAKGQLLFSRVDGTPDWVNAEEFSKAVENKSLKLVFLQACESALPDPYVPFSGVAMRLAASGLPAVVAMQYRIKAEVATAFTEKFYEELLIDKSPIDVAVEAGREQIDDRMDERDRLAFGLPVVYLASHESMVVDDAGHGPEPVDRGDQPGLPPCPRCKAPPHRAEANFCPNCKLQVRCLVCHRRIPDPLKDRVCDHCNTDIHQVDWAPDRVSDRPAGPAAAEAGVLSILAGPRGEGP